MSEGFVLVTAASGVRWTHRLPPLFRQLFESESSTYTYILADPHSEYHLPKRRRGLSHQMWALHPADLTFTAVSDVGTLSNPSSSCRGASSQPRRPSSSTRWT